jgi:hypothetical protein
MAYRDPRMNPDNAPEKKELYKTKLQGLTDVELFSDTKEKIWFSAFASNNPASCYHWQCDYTYDEWVRRKGNSDEYGRAHAQVVRENT